MNPEVRIHRIVNRFVFRNSPGYVMYLVLVVLGILGILGFITFSNRGQTQILAARELKNLQTTLLAESGLAKAEYYLGGGDAKGILWETRGMDDSIGGKGKIHVEATRYGGFTRISSAGFRQGGTCVLSGMAGRDLLQNMTPVITLTGGIPGLVIDQSTSITGNVVLSGGYLGIGKSKQQVKGSNKWVLATKSPRLPFDVAPIRSVIDTLTAIKAALLSYRNAFQGDMTIDSTNDSLARNRDTLVVLGNCTVSGGRIDNKIVVCAGLLSVESKVECTGTRFLADSIDCPNNQMMTS